MHNLRRSLDSLSQADRDHSVFLDEQMLPAYIAMASTIVLITQALVKPEALGLFKKADLARSASSPPRSSESKAPGGAFILCLRFARLLSAILWLASDWFTAKSIWMPGYVALASTTVRRPGQWLSFMPF